MSTEFVKRFPLPMEWEYEDPNVYLLRTEDGPWLIDAGEIHETNFEDLTEGLAEEGISWEDVRGVCATHLHPDHVGLAFKILDASPSTRFLIPSGPSYEKRTEERTRRWLYRIGIPESLHDPFVEEILGYPYLEFMADLKETAETIEPGTTLNLGDRTVEVVKAHGHTPNQVVYYLPEDQLLFSGDHVLLHETPNVSLFPESLERNPLRDFHESLRLLLDREISTVYPGHGQPFRNGHDRIRELLDHHGTRMGHIRRTLSGEPKTALEVAEQIPWGNKEFDELSQVHSFLALGESMSHLVKLAREDEVRRERENGVDYFTMTD